MKRLRNASPTTLAGVFARRYRVIPSPLPALKWWRVVVDEAHMVESTTQETAKMALKIPATHRWCVTGTPIGKGSIDDLYGLLVFLKVH
ncbi:unnamed protein product, partial [Ectocarpus sp. 12 AP-2014]